MSRKTNTWNAYETTLGSGLLAGSSSVLVADTAQPGLVAPFYVVLEPDIPSRREWIKVNTVTATAFENIDRGLEGSAGPSSVGVDHAVDSIVRAVFTKQLQDDLFADIADGVTVADATYLKLAGGEMTGNLNLGGHSLLGLDVCYPKAGGVAFLGHSSVPWKRAYIEDIYSPNGTFVLNFSSKLNIYTDVTMQGEAVVLADTDQLSLLHSSGGLGALFSYTLATGYLDLKQASTGDTIIGFPVASGGGIRVSRELLAPAGTAASPSYAFSADPDVGLYRLGTNVLGVAASGKRVAAFQTAGVTFGDPGVTQVAHINPTANDAAAPAYSFAGDLDTGMFRVATNDIGFATDGIWRFTISGTIKSPAIYSSTSTSAANLVIGASPFTISRSTASSRRYKKHINDLDLAGRLRPRSFRYKDGYSTDDPKGEQTHFYFIAEEVYEEFGISAVELNEDGEPEDVRVKAITAILAAKVNRLEEMAGV